MIHSFRGKYSFLSNFYDAPAQFEGVTYPTAEHAYQAAKVHDSGRDEIKRASTPGQAKRMGRQVNLRPDWEDVKLDVMYEVVRSKFALSPTLQQWLYETGDQELIEGNYWGDQFWGESPLGVGENHLGKILMRIREEINEDGDSD